MYDDIKIDSQMPLPSTGWKGAQLPNYPKAGDYPWKRMKVGDSFFVALPEGGDIVRLMNRITGSGRHRLGRGMVSARCVMENNQIGVRVWRISEGEDERV